MSNYLIIFLIVAVFRGVIWVVQRVQQNAKAREALMTQQANAQQGSVPDAMKSAPGVAARPASAVPAPPSPVPAAPVARTRTSDSARATRLPQRGQTRAATRGAVNAARGGVGARATTRSPAAKVQAPPAPPTAAKASRADVREARVGQSSRDVRNLLRDRGSLRQVLLAREILGPPRGMTV